MLQLHSIKAPAFAVLLLAGNWQHLYNNNLATWNSYMKDAVHPNTLGQNTVIMPELRRVLGVNPDDHRERTSNRGAKPRNK